MLPTSHDLLADVINGLDESAATGRVNTFEARLAGHACLVLGFPELARQASDILAMARKEEFFAGAIMNFTPDAGAIDRLRHLSNLDVLEREFPPFRMSDVESAARSQLETRLAWERRYDEALAAAREHPRQPPETSMIAEIASTAAIHGDFATVEEILTDEALHSGEVYAVRLVLAIEFARRQHRPEAERVIMSLNPAVQGWSSVQLALGLAGRRPWAGYPYADW